jgi:hypothetical protein
MRKHSNVLVAGVATIALTASTPAQSKWSPPPDARHTLWEDPADLAKRDTYLGPWGAAQAPEPNGVYAFVRPKTGGTNPGVVVMDADGREWHVKQPIGSMRGDEGPVEVTLSRVLSAVGYHQPAVYYLPSFMMVDANGRRTEPGGRFRLDDDLMKDRDSWSWSENPFAGTQPLHGLLAILMIFNGTDLKDSNNTLYEYRAPGVRRELRYVVRDLGAALGETGRVEPRRNNIALFEQSRFVDGLEDGFVKFDFHGRHQKLVRDRITTTDLLWACDLLGRLSDQQWADAFRAGGYSKDVAARYITAIRGRLAEGRRVVAGAGLERKR